MSIMYPSSAFLGTIEIPEGNSFRYGQDLSFHQGIPAGRYSVYRFGANDRKLVAPGYGMAGNYGNGAIFTTSSDPEFEKLIQFSSADL